MSQSKKLEAENVNKRVETTKKEIEQLKADLQVLIHSGINRDINSIIKPTAFDNNKIIGSKETKYQPQLHENKLIPTIKPKTSKTVNTKQQTEEECKRNKHYNVTEAREYIRKQREKRAEELKTQITSKGNQLDVKKQKLQELQKKSLDLVKKNVELKRERSKSRERPDNIRLDKSDRISKTNQKDRIDRRLIEPKRNLVQNKEQTLTAPSNKKSKSSDRSNKNPSQGLSPNQTTHKKKSENTNNSNRPLVPETKTSTKKCDKLEIPKCDKNVKCDETKNTNLLYPPKPAQNSFIKPLASSTFSTKTPKPIELERTIYPLTEDLISVISENDKAINNNFEIQPIIGPKESKECAIIACHKETQTIPNEAKKVEVPSWLELNIAPYPNNFINSVRRKLHYTLTNSKSTQNTQTPENIKTKREIRELLIESAKKTHNNELFIPDGVFGNFQLDDDNKENKKSSNNKWDRISRNLFDNYDTASDTSKNIPEICSETDSNSSMKNSISDNQIFKLDTINNLKLDDRTSIITEVSSKNTQSSKSNDNFNKNTYSLDFVSNSNMNKELIEDSNKKQTSNINYSNSNTNKELIEDTSKSKSPSTIKTNKSLSKLHSNSISPLGNQSTKNETNFKNSDTSDIEEEINLLEIESQNNTINSVINKEIRLDDQKFSNENLSKTIESQMSFQNEVNTFPPLKEPTITLEVHGIDDEPQTNDKFKNITLRSKQKAEMKSTNLNDNANKIHLKFEAEVHLLNDFNESIKQFLALEKAYENIKNQSDTNEIITKILENRDTQTSLPTKSLSDRSLISNDRLTDRNQIATINFSRGSEISDELDKCILTNNLSVPNVDSIMSTTGLELTNFNDSITSSSISNDNNKINLSLSNNVDNLKITGCTGLSLNMFEQLIKDEDARIENLKTIIKIRERALLDRTKSELIWLQIQRKHLIETGRLEEASLIKKKQRGILLKHEQERNEMKRLKQIQKEFSAERKNNLKEKRNLIKRQLSTNNMLSKIKVKSPKQRRHSGPLKVVQTRRESITCSETSTRKSSVDDEVLSVASFSQSVVSHVSEEFNINLDNCENRELNQQNANQKISQVKRSLYMREAEIYKRKRHTEKLLQWHRKLLEKEKKMSELEAEANLIITQIPSDNSERNVEKVKFNGKQLNQLWKTMTGEDNNKFIDNKMYTIALEQFCKSAKQYASKNKKISTKIDDTSSVNSCSTSSSSRYDEIKIVDDNPVTSHDIPGNTNSIIDNNLLIKNNSIIQQISNDYTSDFETDTAQEILNNKNNTTTQLSSISNLIDNFNQIENEISSLSIQTVEDINSKQNDLTENNLLNQIQKSDDNSLNSIKKIDDNSLSSIKKNDNNISVSSLIENNLLNQIEKSDDNCLNQIENIDDNLSKSLQKFKSLSEQISDSLDNNLTISNEICNDNTFNNITQKLSESFDNHKSNDKQKIDESINQTKLNDKLLVILPDSVYTKTTEKSSEILDSEINKLTNTSDIIELSSDSELDTSKGNNSFEQTNLLEEVKMSEVESSLVKEPTIIEEIINADDDDNSSIPKTDYHLSNSSNLLTNQSKIDSKNDEEIESESSQSDLKESLENLYLITERSNDKSRSSNDKSRSSNDNSRSSNDQSGSSSVESNEVQSESKQINIDIIEEKDLIKEKDLSVSISEEISFEKTSEVDNSILLDLTKPTTIDNELIIDDKPMIKEMEDGSNHDSIVEEEVSISSTTSNKSLSEDNSKSKRPINVKKRVSEILADLDASLKGDRSPRLQDLYVTTYDVLSPTTSSEESSTEEDNKKVNKKKHFGTEAEELLRKQLAIEQEIKQLEQQQKEQLPYVFMREIPNKPPPPYTPPSAIQSAPLTVLPTEPKEINEITNYSSKVLYKAFQMNNLENAKFSENSFKLISNLIIGKQCCEFVFNICKEIAKDHYKQFVNESGPSWLIVSRKSQLIVQKPLDANGLEKLFNKKLKELFGFTKFETNENAVMKWIRKKRDHVDEILVYESQEEESQWTNYDKDELIVKDEITNDIMKMLVNETAIIFNKILSKKTNLC